MGVDRKASREPVRAPGGLLQQLQRRVALQALRESSSSFGTDIVLGKTASTRPEQGRVLRYCQWALTEEQTLRVAAHFRLVIFVLLRMAASSC